MRDSVIFCRQQQAAQTTRAQSAPLENQRKIALSAAKAWGAKADAAEKQALERRIVEPRAARIDSDQNPWTPMGPNA